jgi:hypothetical protein
LIYNKINNSFPIIAHAPGKLEFIPLWDVMLNMALNAVLPVAPPRETTVITFNNGASYTGHKPLGILEAQLDRYGIPYICAGFGISPWQNKIKVRLLLECLDKVTTRNVLVSDSSDVFILDSLDKLEQKFEDFGSEAVFNAEKILWPPDLPDEIGKFTKSLHDYLNLNAGLWMGRVNFAKEIAANCLTITPDTKYYKSEQALYQYCYMKYYPRMLVDYNCQMFQGLNRVDENEIEITNV